MRFHSCKLGIIGICILICGMTGCNLLEKPNWTLEEAMDSPVELNAPRMASDAVVLEIAFIHVNPEDIAATAPLCLRWTVAEAPEQGARGGLTPPKGPPGWPENAPLAWGLALPCARCPGGR